MGIPYHFDALQTERYYTGYDWKLRATAAKLESLVTLKNRQFEMFCRKMILEDTVLRLFMSTVALFRRGCAGGRRGGVQMRPDQPSSIRRLARLAPRPCPSRQCAQRSELATTLPSSQPRDQRLGRNRTSHVQGWPQL